MEKILNYVKLSSNFYFVVELTYSLDNFLNEFISTQKKNANFSIY